MKRDNLINRVEEYTSAFLRKYLSQKLVFHNVRHTYEVVEKIQEIGNHVGLSEEQATMVTVAGWFHDCGYAIRYVGHEDESKKIACGFLKTLACGDGFVQRVLDCIEATRFPQHPQTLEECVICDADLYHLTRTNYYEYEEAIRSEFNSFLNLTYTDDEWLATNCAMLTGHRYQTEWGRDVLQKAKEANLQKMGCKT